VSRRDDVELGLLRHASELPVRLDQQ
jgi:hypothetical protein